MANNRDEEILMEDVEIKWRNFAGNVTEFNKLGYNLFTIVVPDNIDVDQMIKDGWNIKWKPVDRQDPDAGEWPSLEIRVNMDSKYPPKVVMRSEQTKKRTFLTKDLLVELDSADIVKCDIMVGPNHYNINGKKGIRAYLRSMWATVHEDPLDMKYRELDAGQSPNDELDDNYNE